MLLRSAPGTEAQSFVDVPTLVDLILKKYATDLRQLNELCVYHADKETADGCLRSAEQV